MGRPREYNGPGNLDTFSPRAIERRKKAENRRKWEQRRAKRRKEIQEEVLKKLNAQDQEL